MSHPQGPTNDQYFNRNPKRESYDVIVDSANRDKVRYPESNNFKIDVPICLLKNIRNVGIFYMTLVKTESTIHADKLDGNGKPIEGYTSGNQQLRFNEGIHINNANRQVPFRLGVSNEVINLPKTVQETCPLEFKLVADRLSVTTPYPHNYRIGQSLQLFGYPYVPGCPDYANCVDPNTTYKVVEIPNNVTVYLLPDDLRFSLGNLCDGTVRNPDVNLCPINVCDSPRLLLGPLNDQEELAQLAQDTYNYVNKSRGVQIWVTWDPAVGVYTIENNQGYEPFVTASLLGQGSESYTATVPVGNYSPSELAVALEMAMNQPIVIAGVNDTFEFREIDSATVHSVTLPAGSYTPETLAMEMAAQMNAAAGITNEYSVCYNNTLGCFVIAGNTVSFELRLKAHPEFAKLIGFVPIDQAGFQSYASQRPVFYPFIKGDGSKLSPFFRSNNHYKVHYDVVNRRYTIVADGQQENSIVGVTPLADSGSVVRTAVPHGLDLGDLVFVMNPPAGVFAAGIYIVECVISATEVRLNMAVCGGAPGVEQPVPPGTIFASIPLPFNIDFAQPHSGILDLLGLVPASKQDQTVYQSTKVCLICQPLYLLVQVPEFVHSRLWAQFQFDGPPQKFFARLDADFDERTYDLTCVPEAVNESLFIGQTIDINTITIKIYKPDGNLYDTNRCDWSMWLRFIVEK